jgi:hypothetical protein
MASCCGETAYWRGDWMDPYSLSGDGRKLHIPIENQTLAVQFVVSHY